MGINRQRAPFDCILAAPSVTRPAVKWQRVSGLACDPAYNCSSFLGVQFVFLVFATRNLFKINLCHEIFSKI